MSGGAVFVYGTLMPGRLRWPTVAPFVSERLEAVVRGTLMDTGRGYPGLRLPGDGDVHGWLLHLHPARAEHALALLDEVEGPDYERVRITTLEGVAADTYRWLADPPGAVPLVSGRWEATVED